MEAMKSTFRRFFVRYAGMNLLLLLLPLCLAIGYYFVSIVAIQNGVDLLIANRLADEQSRLERLKVDIDGFMTDLSEDYDLSAYLNRTEPLSGIERYNLKKVMAKLRSFTLSHDGVGYSMLYLRNIDWAVSNTGFDRYEDFWPTDFKLVTGTLSAQAWKEGFLMKQPQPDTSGIVEYQASGDDHRGIMLSKNIGYGAYNRGKIIVLLDSLSLGRSLSRVPEYYSGIAWIENSEGSVLASSAGKDSFHPRFDPSDDLPRSLDTDRGPYRCYAARLAYEGWVLKMALPEGIILRDVRKLRNLALILFALALVAGSAVSWVGAFVHTRPLARILDRFLPTELRERRVPELYNTVEESINALYRENDSMKDHLESGRKLLRAFTLQNLFSGAYRERPQFEAAMESSGISFDQDSWQIILFRLDGIDLSRTPQDLLEMVETALGPACGSRCHLVPMASTHLAIVASPDSLPNGAVSLERIIVPLMGKVVIPQGTRRYVGVSAPCHDPFLLSTAYTEAEAAIEWLRNDPQAELQYYDSMTRSDTAFFYPINLESEIIKSVLAGNREFFDLLADRLAEANIRRRRLAARQSRDLLSELRGTALKIQEQCGETHLAPIKEADPSLAFVDGFEAWKSCMHAFIDERISEKKSHNSALVIAIRELVRKKYGSVGLNLTYIADSLNITENYLSNFFKEQTGENLSAFIQDLRLKEAKELLEESEKSIEEIAVCCGYSTANSFRRAFRKCSGYTPSDYRSQKRGTAFRPGPRLPHP
jgi:Response regulator containing CheY-like receiver domain and AraC-type DNA-binding domain